MAVLADLVDDDFILPRLQALVECVCAELEKAGGPSLCYCGLMVGTIAPIGILNCSDDKGCGVAWVRPMGGAVSASFPEAEEASTACVSPLVFQVEIGVGRCAPRRQGREGWDPQEMFEATRLYMSDMRAVKRALLCCFPAAGKALGKDYQSALGTWEPIEQSAGVSGGIWTGWIG